MEGIKTFIAGTLVACGVLMMLLILRDQSFSYDKALELRSEAIDECVEEETLYGNYSPSEGAFGSGDQAYASILNSCNLNHHIESFHISTFDKVILFLFGTPLLIAIIVPIFVGFTIFTDPNFEGRSKKKIIPGIGNPGREWLPRRKSKFSNEDKEIFLYALENIEDIIKKNHFTKADYRDWFFFASEIYIKEYPKHQEICSPEDLIKKLRWAKDQIPKIYKGKSQSVGKKNFDKIDFLISKLENL